MRINCSLSMARVAGILSLALGAIVLLGWYLHEPALIQVKPAFVPMQYNTALCFSLTGLTAVLGNMFRDRAGITSWAATLGALIISLGVAALAGYMIGVEGAYG